MIRTRLAQLMLERNVKAYHLANETGIARSTISRISNNKSEKLDLESINKLCSYLRCTPADFFEYTPYDFSYSAGYEGKLTPQDPANNILYNENAFLIINVHQQLNKIASIEFNGTIEYAQVYEEVEDISYSLDFSSEEDEEKWDKYIGSLPIILQTEIKEEIDKFLQSLEEDDPVFLREIHVKFKNEKI